MKESEKDSILDFAPEAVVIDAGSFPTNTIALHWLDGCDRIVCCDGAANRYLAKGGKVWRIVGDCDSMSEKIRTRYADIIRRFPDQETNDQTKSVRYLMSKGMRKIAILGATGLREDHTLGNISLLIDYMKMGVEARAYTNFGVFIPVIGDSEFHCAPSTQVSIFNFGAKDLRSKGLLYPIRDFDSWWQGTLNESSGSQFSVKGEGAYLVFINYPEV